jgi:hypothetical protein
MAMHFPASWRLSMQSHLSRTFPRRRCLETQGQFDDELIDRVLAGLMSDIRDHSSLQHQMGLDAIGKSEVTFRRILGQL